MIQNPTCFYDVSWLVKVFRVNVHVLQIGYDSDDILNVCDDVCPGETDS